MRKDHTVAELAQLSRKSYDLRESSYNSATGRYRLSCSEAAEEICGPDSPLLQLVYFATVCGELYEYYNDYCDAITE